MLALLQNRFFTVVRIELVGNSEGMLELKHLLVCVCLCMKMKMFCVCESASDLLSTFSVALCGFKLDCGTRISNAMELFIQLCGVCT